MKVVFNEIDHFHPNFDESVPNHGAVATATRNDKERKYHELLTSERCQLVVVAVETGGKWNDEAMELIQNLTEVKSREAPPFLRGSAFHAWKRRWTKMCWPCPADGRSHLLLLSPF